MTKDKPQPERAERALFSPGQRQQVLDRVLAALETDERIAGVLVVGSDAVGFDDRYSDIDLSVVIAAEDQVLLAFREWRSRIERLLPVIHCLEAIYGPNNYLHGFLLEGFLEVDIGFVSFANLVARRERWKLAFDRSGKIEGIMQSSWQNRPQRDLRAGYFRRLDSVWHYITHVVIALKRNQPWKAMNYLEVIRNRTIELAGLRLGLDTGHFRQVDQMPAEFLSDLQKALISSTDHADILRALKMAAACFFREAQALDEMLGLNTARPLAAQIQHYLDLSERGQDP